MARRTHFIATAILTVMLVPVVSAAQGPQVAFPDFSQLAQKASETVDISLDSSLLGLAARFMNGEGEDEKAVKDLLTNLRAIYVRSFEFDADGSYTRDDLDQVRRLFSAPGWSRLVGVRSKRERTDVDIYVWMDGKSPGVPGGIAILSTEPRRLTVVNIVGRVDLERLRKLEGEFGIPKFDLERKPKDDEEDQ
jgi:Domain of unknown function (DUF4252)